MTRILLSHLDEQQGFYLEPILKIVQGGPQFTARFALRPKGVERERREF